MKNMPENWGESWELDVFDDCRNVKAVKMIHGPMLA
jgi:hypothetical protein